MNDKLILVDGTAVELESGASLSNMQVVFTDKDSMVETWDMFTDENLKIVKITDCHDTPIAEYTNLVLTSVTLIEREDGSILTTFALRQKSEVELLKEELIQQKEETTMLTECLLEMSEIVYGA